MFTFRNSGKVLLVLVILLLVYFDQSWNFYAANETIDRMNIAVEKSIFSQASDHLFYFGQEDRTIKLYYNPLLGKQPLDLYALTHDEQIVTIPPEQSQIGYRLAKEYSGTIAAVIPPVQVDINNDGQAEKIRFSAKIDTLFAQPFVPIRTTFGIAQIPLEICFKGHQDILLLFNNKPLCKQTVRLVSRRGFGLGVDRTVTTDAAGMFRVPDVRDLRTGISITYLAQDRTWYISSFRLEANSLFTPRYQRALATLVKSLQWSILLTLLLVVCQKGYLRSRRTASPGELAGNVSKLLNKMNVTK